MTRSNVATNTVLQNTSLNHFPLSFGTFFIVRSFTKQSRHCMDKCDRITGSDRLEVMCRAKELHNSSFCSTVRNNKVFTGITALLYSWCAAVVMQRDPPVVFGKDRGVVIDQQVFHLV